MIFARQSTAIIVTVGPVLDASGVAVTDGVVGDFKISKNGGAPAALNGSATLTHRNTGHYSLSLTTTDMNTVGTAEIVIDDTTNACPIKEITVVEPTTYDVLFADAAPGPASPTNITAAAGCAVSSLGANVITAAATAADFGTEIATALWTDTTAGDFTVAASIGKSIMNGVALGTGLTINAYTGNTAQTGDSFARIGANGGSLSAIPWNAAWDAEVQSEVADELVLNNLDHLCKVAVADTQNMAEVVDNTIIGNILSKSASTTTYDPTTDSLEALRDNTGTAGAGLTAIDLPDQTMNITGNLSGSVGSVTGAVGSVTGNVGGNVTGTIGGLTAAALKDFFDTDSTTTYASAVAGSVVKEIADNAGGSALTEAGIADAVWDEAIAGHLGAGSTGEALSNAGSAGDPWGTALPGAYGAGTAGKIIGDNINATISSRATQASVDDLPTNAELATALDALPTAAENADAVWDEDATAHQTQGTFGQAIGDPGADTDTIWALANTNLNATVSSRASQASLDVVDGVVDSILTDTGNIITDIAALPTAVENADALLARNVAGGSSAGRTVKQALFPSRNKTEIAGGVLTVYEVDDTTPSWDAAVSTAPGDPISGVDPT